MIETFATKQQPLALVLDVEASEPCELAFTGYDAELADGGYFNRRVGHREPFTGRHRLVFPMPLTPRRLRVNMQASAGLLLLHGYQLVPLQKSDGGLSADDRDFVEFAQWLAVHLPQLPASIPERFPYQSKGGRYMAILSERIENSDGTENSTPARISRATGIAQLSKRQMRAFTVPMRLMILLHEYNHYKLNSTDESECDLAAVGIFCALGYSSTEGLYAFAKVLDDSPDKPQLRERVGRVLDALLAYQAREPRYTAYLYLNG